MDGEGEDRAARGKYDRAGEVRGSLLAHEDLRFWRNMRTLAVDAAQPELLRFANDRIANIEDYLRVLGEREGD